jgi:hypothetical protein
MPVDGPARWQSMSTHGSSAIAPRPSASTIRLTPGPEEEVMDRLPANDAPSTMLMDAISSSA